MKNALENKTTGYHQKKILEAANPYLVLKNFGGESKDETYPWYIGIIRWLLRMPPEQIPVVTLPKNKGKTIKFRRYESLKAHLK